MGRQAPENLVAIHLNLLTAALAIADQLPAESEKKRATLDALATFRATGFGYYLEQSTRPGRADAFKRLRPTRLLLRFRAGRLHHLSGRGHLRPAQRVEIVYPTLTYFNEVDRGGHFAAWEEPELFTSEVRAAFRSLR
jgi:hypothetical protein